MAALLLLPKKASITSAHQPLSNTSEPLVSKEIANSEGEHNQENAGKQEEIKP
jgi:hypothetical protein